MTTIIVRPVEGRRVRMPVSSEIITVEIAVEDAPFFRRRIADGDLVLVETPAAKTITKEA